MHSVKEDGGTPLQTGVMLGSVDAGVSWQIPPFFVIVYLIRLPLFSTDDQRSVGESTCAVAACKVV